MFEVITEATLQCVPAHKVIGGMLVLTRRALQSDIVSFWTSTVICRTCESPGPSNVITLTCSSVSFEKQVEEPTLSNQNRLAATHAVLESHLHCELINDCTFQLPFMLLGDK